MTIPTAPQEGEVEAVLDRENEVEGGERQSERGEADSGQGEIGIEPGPGGTERGAGRPRQAPQGGEQGRPEDRPKEGEGIEGETEVEPGKGVADQRVRLGEQDQEERAAKDRQDQHAQAAAEAAAAPGAPGSSRVEQRAERAQRAVEEQPFGPAPAVVEPGRAWRQHGEGERRPVKRQGKGARIRRQRANISTRMQAATTSRASANRPIVDPARWNQKNRSASATSRMAPASFRRKL
jgi:hypothetical protein